MLSISFRLPRGVGQWSIASRVGFRTVLVNGTVVLSGLELRYQWKPPRPARSRPMGEFLARCQDTFRHCKPPNRNPKLVFPQASGTFFSGDRTSRQTWQLQDSLGFAADAAERLDTFEGISVA
jgi:hypothetical protein